MEGTVRATVEKEAVRRGGIAVFVNDAYTHENNVVVVWPPGRRHQPSFHVSPKQLVSLDDQ